MANTVTDHSEPAMQGAGLPCDRLFMLPHAALRWWWGRQENQAIAKMLDGIKGLLEIGDSAMAEKTLNLLPIVRSDWFPKTEEV